MFDRILNMPLNEIWDRKKEGNNYFPGWKVCLPCAYNFTDSRLEKTCIPLVRVNDNYFMNTFFPSTITEWNKLYVSIRNSTSLHIFKGRLWQFVRPLENSVFTCHNPMGIKYFTRLRLGFSNQLHTFIWSLIF